MKLDLTNDETQYVLNILAERPFKESAPLIQKIVNQVNADEKQNALDTGNGSVGPVIPEQPNSRNHTE